MPQKGSWNGCVIMNKKKLIGRPKKFDEASRPVTVTLPERTLRQLCNISEDRAEGIVKAVDIVAGSATHPIKPVELVEVTPGKAIIVVGPSKSLRKIAWLRMVEITPIRYLLSLPPGTSIESLEIAILDLLETLSPEAHEDRVLLEALRNCIAHQRRGQMISKGELLFIDLAR
jgi:hypothetical protein